MNLVEVAEEIQHRIIHIFGRGVEGKRAANGGNPKLDHDPHFRDYVWFYEVRLCLDVFPLPFDRAGRADLMLGASISMRMMGEASGRPIRLDGEGRLSVLAVCSVLKRFERSGLVAYHILQSGATCRLPRTPKSK